MLFVTGKDSIVMLPFWHQIAQCDLYYLQFQEKYLPQAIRTVRYIPPIFIIDAILKISDIVLFA